jgi:hypothetical protein
MGMADHTGSVLLIAQKAVAFEGTLNQELEFRSWNLAGSRL